MNASSIPLRLCVCLCVCLQVCAGLLDPAGTSESAGETGLCPVLLWISGSHRSRPKVRVCDVQTGTGAETLRPRSVCTLILLLEWGCWSADVTLVFSCWFSLCRTSTELWSGSQQHFSSVFLQCLWPLWSWCWFSSWFWSSGPLQSMDPPTSWCTCPYVPSWEASLFPAVKDWAWQLRTSLEVEQPVTEEPWLSSWACWGRWWSASWSSSFSSIRHYSVSAPTFLRPSTTWPSHPQWWWPRLFSSESGALWPSLTPWSLSVASPQWAWVWLCYGCLRKLPSPGRRRKEERRESEESSPVDTTSRCPTSHLTCGLCPAEM